MKSNTLLYAMQVAYGHICIFPQGTTASLKKYGLEYSRFLEI